MQIIKWTIVWPSMQKRPRLFLLDHENNSNEQKIDLTFLSGFFIRTD